VTSLDKAKAIIIHDVDGLHWWRHRMCSLANMASRFLDHACKSSTMYVSFSVLTKCWVLILPSKLSEHYAILGKYIYIYV